MMGRSAVPRPAVLWIHGGGWTGGWPEMFLPAVEYTASQGSVGFTLQYRLGSDGPAVEDVEAALVWIRRNAKELGVDPQRIIAAGDSAGGHLALALGTVTRERANAILPGGRAIPRRPPQNEADPLSRFPARVRCTWLHRDPARSRSRFERCLQLVARIRPATTATID